MLDKRWNSKFYFVLTYKLLVDLYCNAEFISYWTSGFDSKFEAGKTFNTDCLHISVLAKENAQIMFNDTEKMASSAYLLELDTGINQQNSLLYYCRQENDCKLIQNITVRHFMM